MVGKKYKNVEKTLRSKKVLNKKFAELSNILFCNEVTDLVDSGVCH